MMARGSPLLALATGFGTGYLAGKQREVDQARIDEDRAMRKQEFDARMEELNNAKQTRISLADAAKPAVVTEDLSRTLPDDQAGPSLAQYKVTGTGLDKTVYNETDADTAAKDYSAPEAVAGRQAAVLRAKGAPERAMTLENAATSKKREQEKYTQEQLAHAKKLKEEGVFSAARALRGGDAAGFVSSFNAGGEHRIEGEPVITKEERDIPGIGKVPTYTAKFMMRRPDGTVTEETRNSHDLSMQLLPFEKAMELQRKGTDSDNKAAFQSGVLDNKIKQLELTGQIAEAKALKAAANGGPVGREERLRYTSLFSDAGRRMGEAQRALSSLQKDTLFMMNAKKAGTPEATQLQDLQESIKSYGEERTLYQGLLAGSQKSGKPPGLADAAPKTGAPKPKTASNGDYSNLWK